MQIETTLLLINRVRTIVCKFDSLIDDTIGENCRLIRQQ